jgi:molybdopterin-guanine dinucleotide biosynthesis protein A
LELIDLPVFQLDAGEKGERETFLEWLAFELARLNLLTTVVRPCNSSDSLSLHRLVREYDVVFVDCRTDIPLKKISLLSAGDENPGDGLSCILNDNNSLSVFFDLFLAEIQATFDKIPVWGCVLIGGKSSRMGRPKHLITDDYGKTWLERTVDILNPLVDGIVISGAGTLPESLTGLPRLVDIPGVVGPLTGILSASRWLPLVSWLVIACDMPHISTEAVEWLLTHRKPGCWGCAPRMMETEYIEPLFAWYDARAACLFERQALTGEMRITDVARHPKIMNPVIPGPLRYGWENINTPGQLQQVKRVG